MSSKSLRVASRLRLNVPRNAAAQSTAGACIPEMELLLECLERNDFIDLACAAQTTMLAECMGRADQTKGSANRHRPTVNYHLARLARQQNN